MDYTTGDIMEKFTKLECRHAAQPIFYVAGRSWRDGGTCGKYQTCSIPREVMLTKQDFSNLSPYHRGYVVYLYGLSDGEPNVPEETNPYAPGTRNALDWVRGMIAAVMIATRKICDT